MEGGYQVGMDERDGSRKDGEDRQKLHFAHGGG